MSKRILIVDDEKISLRMTEHILATKYETVCATGGQEAIEICRRERPDMILSDLHMPGMSGYELLNTMQELYSDRISFMFMTADKSDDAESQGFESGAVDFIRKPFRADVLLKRVENILSNADEIRGLKLAAQTDPMTGLLNKVSSQEEIGRMCEEHSGTLMMIDLDSFKLVNDLYGHNMGDKILIRFAEIIRAVIRSGDIAGRMGGDEFIAFCQNVRDEEVIAKKAAFINDEIMRSAKEFMGEDMTIPLGASIGAVTVPDEGTDFLTLYRKADKALYKVKQNGKHGYDIYRDKTSAEVSTENIKESSLLDEMKLLGERSRGKGAFRLNADQFKLLYRFLVRMEANYQKKNHFLLFSLKENDSSKPDTVVSEKLFEVICSSLRQSDVASDKGSGQVTILLLEAGDADTGTVIDRIRSRWGEENTGFELSVESELIKAE